MTTPPVRDPTRRRSLALIGGGLLASGLARPFIRSAKAAVPHLVIIGGGAGGASVAGLVADAAKGAIRITLIEANPRHTTCFFSNWVLGGLWDLSMIQHDYKDLQHIAVVHARAQQIDAESRTVHLDDGSTIGYDRLVLSPGVEVLTDTLEGYDDAAAAAMPHAYTTGPEIGMLTRQLAAMDDGGTVLIIPPALPYRCPPAPYERASMIAHYLTQHKPRSKIMILDAKDGFSQQELFLNAWQRHYPGMIDWVPSEFLFGGIGRVDAAAMSVFSDDETFSGAVINLIPPQQAGRIAQNAGLADADGWCSVIPETLESRVAPNIHILGDAIDPGDMTKAASSAQSQARLCAQQVMAAMIDRPAEPVALTSACWSLFAPSDAATVTANYAIQDDHFKILDAKISALGESDDLRAQTAAEAEHWYAQITNDMFH